jgi:hypothetical protein
MYNNQYPEYPPDIAVCLEEALILFIIRKSTSKFPSWNATAGKEYQ